MKTCWYLPTQHVYFSSSVPCCSQSACGSINFVQEQQLVATVPAECCGQPLLSEISLSPNPLLPKPHRAAGDVGEPVTSRAFLGVALEVGVGGVLNPTRRVL